MKIRQGFVSNSSSASFIISWNVDHEDDLTPEQAVHELYGFGCEEDDKVVEAIKSTRKIDKNQFESHFWTCMMNDMDDFGEAATSLLANLHAHHENLLEIGGGLYVSSLKTKIEED